MALEEDALAPFVVSNSICHSPNNRLKELNSAQLGRIVALFASLRVLIDRAERGEHRRTKYY